MDTEPVSVKVPRPRGRPPGKKKLVTTPLSSQQELDEVQEAHPALPIEPGRPTGPTRIMVGVSLAGILPRGQVTLGVDAPIAEEQPEALSETNADQLSAFSSLLRHILRRDRGEIARIAEEVGVAENTMYRWLNGNSEPRATHVKKLLEVLPEHRRNLTYAINQTFPGLIESLSPDVQEVPKDIYRRVLELATTMVEDDSRCWTIMQTIFEYALLHLDANRQGLAITYARLMPTRDDRFHCLYEMEMRGTYPWPFTLESKAYLGSTTLAGRAAMLQRMHTWDDLENEGRLPVVVDKFERSACAYPVMYAGRIAGVLIISSTQAGFFTNPVLRQAVIEYAQLLALALKERDFYPCSELDLKPMPELGWQREEIRRSYINRVIACARNRDLSLPEAEEYIRMDMAEEFERYAAL